MNASESLGSLGRHIESFRPMMANLIAGVVFTLILIAAGGAALTALAWLAPWSDDDFDGSLDKWMILVGWFAVGIGAIIGGISLARFTLQLSKREVDLYELGLRCADRNGSREITWSRVREIRESIVYERLPILKGPANLLTPKISSRDYMLLLDDGSELQFDGNSVKRIGRFAKLLRERAKVAGVEWVVIDNK